MRYRNQVFQRICFILMIACCGEAMAQRIGGFGQTNFSTSGTGGTSTREYVTHGMMGQAFVEADYDTRSIIVIADEETRQYIEDIIKQLDRPVPQVLIKVVFVEVTHRNDLDVGTEFSFQHNNDKNTFQTAFGLEAQQFGGFYRILENDFQATVRAIEEYGKTEILSRPSILTRNNQEAVITVGQEVPFLRNSIVSDSGQITNSVEYEDIGIILRVTPFITPDGLVEMIIAPEISTITDETITVTETLSAPVFGKRSADTVVTTPNGQTVVIGGMMEDNITESDRKIPLLGDIPILGYAFKRRIKDNQKTELLIFLTPIVVEAPDSLSDLSRYESQRSKLVPQTFDKEQLDYYLDNLGANQRLDYKTSSQSGPVFEQSEEEKMEQNDDSAQDENDKSGFTTRAHRRNYR